MQCQVQLSDSLFVEFKHLHFKMKICAKKLLTMKPHTPETYGTLWNSKITQVKGDVIIFFLVSVERKVSYV